MVDSATLFGRCLALMRRSIRVSQAEFAEQLEISRPSLTHIETGRTPPGFYTLMKMGQRVGAGRLDRDATAMIALFHLSARALSAEGIPVRNRPRREDDILLDNESLDRVIGRVFDGDFREIVPVQVVTFAGEDDDDEPVRFVRADQEFE